MPRCLSGAALYGNSNALRLPCSSLVKEFKITKARELLQYAKSEDPKVAAAGIQKKIWQEEECEERVASGGGESVRA